MNAYHQLLDEVAQAAETPPSQRSLRQQLLGPEALRSAQDLMTELPLVRKYLGPRAWYQFIEKAHPIASLGKE